MVQNVRGMMGRGFEETEDRGRQRAEGVTDHTVPLEIKDELFAHSLLMVI